MENMSGEMEEDEMEEVIMEDEEEEVEEVEDSIEMSGLPEISDVVSMAEWKQSLSVMFEIVLHALLYSYQLKAFKMWS